MQMPKPSEMLSATFDGIVSQFETIVQKKVVGCPSAFVNGNMFASVFGDRVTVKLSEADQEEALGAGGEPHMPLGRRMKEYVSLSEETNGDPAALEAWIRRGLDYVGTLPPKQPKKRR